MDKIYEYKKKITDLKNNLAGVPEIVQKVKEATNNEKWGPNGTLMQEICKATYRTDEYRLVMQTLWKRLDDRGKDWRHVYKALTVIEYMLKNGADHVYGDVRDSLHRIQTLVDFQYINEETGKDEGLNVREKSKNLIELVQTPTRIKFERDKARQARDKYVGISAQDRGFGRSSYSSYDNDYNKDRDTGSNSINNYSASGSNNFSNNTYNSSSNYGHNNNNNNNNNNNDDNDSADGPIPVSKPVQQQQPVQRQQPKSATMIDFSSPAQPAPSRGGGGGGSFFNAQSTGFANDPFANDAFDPRGGASAAPQGGNGGFSDTSLFGQGGGGDPFASGDGFGDFAAAPAPRDEFGSFEAANHGGQQQQVQYHQQQQQQQHNPFQHAGFNDDPFGVGGGGGGGFANDPFASASGSSSAEPAKKKDDWSTVSSLVNLENISSEKKKEDPAGKKAEPVFANAKITPSSGTTAVINTSSGIGIQGNYGAMRTQPVGMMGAQPGMMSAQPGMMGAQPGMMSAQPGMMMGGGGMGMNPMMGGGMGMNPMMGGGMGMNPMMGGGMGMGMNPMMGGMNTMGGGMGMSPMMNGGAGMGGGMNAMNKPAGNNNASGGWGTGNNNSLL